MLSCIDSEHIFNGTEKEIIKMVREHGSLTKDAETNQAAWEAAKGAAYGGVKVRELI